MHHYSHLNIKSLDTIAHEKNDKEVLKNNEYLTCPKPKELVCINLAMDLMWFEMLYLKKMSVQ